MIGLFDRYRQKDVSEEIDTKPKEVGHHYRNIKVYPIYEPKRVRKERMKRLKDYRVEILERTPLNKDEEKIIIKVSNGLNGNVDYFNLERCISDELTDEELIQDVFFEIDLRTNLEHTKKMIEYVKNGGLDELEPIYLS